MIIDDIIIEAGPGITEDEIRQIVAEEKVIWHAKGKRLGKIEMYVLACDPGAIEVRSHEKSPIKRIRRITGYLSEEDNFNFAKKAELDSRVSQC